MRRVMSLALFLAPGRGSESCSSAGCNSHLVAGDDDWGDDDICWAGAKGHVGCTCSSGEPKLTGKTDFDDSTQATWYEYTCCTGDNVSSMGEHCGDFKPLPAGCSSSACTSPDGKGGTDCWAGSDVEPCTCSIGEAWETGGTWKDYHGERYFHYSCCKLDSNQTVQGDYCGDYRGCLFVAGEKCISSWHLAALIMGALSLLGSCLYCRHAGKKCDWLLPGVAEAPSTAVQGQHQVVPLQVAAPATTALIV